MEWQVKEIISLFLIVFSYSSPGLSASEIPGLSLDRWLMPKPGFEDRNIAVLEKNELYDPAALAILGIQYLSQNRQDDATRVCTRAVSFATTFEPAYCLSLIELKKGQYEEARRWAKEAAIRAPGSPIPDYLGARIRFLQQKKSEMVILLEDAMANDIKENRHHWEWIILRWLDELGDLSGAIQASGRLMELLPNDPEVLHSASVLFEKASNLERAVNLEIACISKAPWHGEAAVRLLKLLERLQETEGLMVWADKFLASPHLVTYWEEIRRIRLGVLTRKAKRRIHELTEMTGFTLELTSPKVDPSTTARFRYDVGLAFLEAEDSSSAREQLAIASRLAPLDSDVLLKLADAQLRCGAHVDARKTLSTDIS